MTEHRLLDLTKLAKIKDGTGHSIFSPSASHMWLVCPGSLIPNILAPDDGNEDAAYGTVAHAVTEEWLRTDERPIHLLGRTEVVHAGEKTYMVDIDEEMMSYVEQAYERSAWNVGIHYVERRVDFSHLTPIPNQKGTLDFAACRPKRVVVDDHKFGSSPNNIVFAEENPQLMIYALAFDHERPEFMFEDFILRINQPRLNHFDEWHTTRSRMMEFAAYVKERALLAWTIDAPRVPGEKQCRFCKIRGTCAANAQMQINLTAGVFEDLDKPQTHADMAKTKARIDDDLEEFRLYFANVGDLTTEQRAKLFKYRTHAEGWWKAITVELQRDILRGDRVPGFKVVESRTHRRWKNGQAAYEALAKAGYDREDLFDESFVGPAEAERLLRKKGYNKAAITETLSPLVEKPKGKHTFAPQTDKRAEVVDVTSIAFEDVDLNREPEEL